MPLKTAVIAIGGNSLIPDNSKREMTFQWDAVRESCGHIASMIGDGWRVVITHGIGPQNIERALRAKTGTRFVPA